MSSVQAALQELDEGDRSLLLARYCDGLDASELGLRLGIPASTVRSRLSRATARVRRTLDERWGGDRAAWAPAILAVPLPRHAEVSSITVSGGLLVSVLMKKIVIALVVVLAGAGIWLATRDARDGSPDDEHAAARAESGTPSSPDRTRRDGEDVVAGIVLAGHVVADDDGAPIVGAVVMAVPEVGSVMISTTPGHASVVPRAVADADGRFAISGLPPGAYGLTAAAPGHLPTQIPAAVLAKLAGGDELVVRLRGGGNRVEGTVTDITGGPVEGELVRAQPLGDAAVGLDRAGYGAITDAEGHYVLSVPDGGWNFVAGGEDYTKETRRVAVKAGPGRADFVLVPAGSIHGRVIDRATGAPVADARVGFHFQMRLGGSTSSSRAQAEDITRTDAQGRFELRPLEPGEYTLHATAPGRASADEPVVHVAIAEQVTDVVLAVDPAFDATGRVVDAGDPATGIAGVEVTAFAGDGNGGWFAVTGADGAFTLHGLSPGAYLLGFQGGGAIASGMEHSLRIEDADVEDATFALARGVTVSGRVSPGGPASVRVRGRAESGGFEVLLAARKVASAKTRVDESGAFRIDGVPLGEWKIVATGDDGSEGTVEIDVPAEGLEDVEVSMAPRSRVVGVVQDATGAPLAGLAVNLQVPPDPAMPPGPWKVPRTEASGVSRDDGTFEIVGVPPGHYTIAVQDGRTQAVPFADEGTEVAVEAIEGRDVDDLVLRVRLPDGRIAGVVRDADGEPVPDAWVQGRPSGTLGLSHDRALAAVTDQDGRFTLRDLSPGEYMLDARGPDADAQATVTGVAVGEDVTITLGTFGAIVGRVVQGGAPVTEFRLDLGGGDERRVITADGSFVVERIRPGRASVAVSTEAGSAYAEAEVKAGETAEVELAIEGWGSVTGTAVSVLDGTRLAGLKVEVESASGVRDASEQLVSAMTGAGAIVTDDEGRFAVEGVGAGEVTVSLSLGDFASSNWEQLGTKVVQLAAGQRLDLGEIATLPPARVAIGEQGSLGWDLTTSATFPIDPAVTSDDKHVWVEWVDPAGPAARAGVRIGDRVTSIDGVGEAEIGWRTLVEAFGRARIRAGQRYAIGIDREGEARDVQVRAAAKREK